MKILNSSAFLQRPSCVLLDLDNTLYPYGPCNDAGMAAAGALAQQAFGISPADFAGCFADARSELKARLGQTASSHSRLLYFQRAIERAGFSSQPFFVLQIEQAFWRAYLDRAVLFDQTHEFLDDLRIAGIPTIIVTDLTARIQLRKLIVLGLDKLVDWVVTSEESGHDKPHPASFELALAKVGGVEGPVWMIGDEIEKDMKGARRAVGAVTLLKAERDVQLPDGADAVDAVFRDFGDLRRTLAAIS